MNWDTIPESPEEIKQQFEEELARLREEGGFGQSPLRREYEARLEFLEEGSRVMLSQGADEETVAKRFHKLRRDIGKEYKDSAPPLLRAYIYDATEKKYGDSLGPTYEQLRQTKTPAQIIESAHRPIADISERLTEEGFIDWFRWFEASRTEKSE